MKYLIWSFDYSHASAGPKVLHRLCHELNEAGQEAYVSHSITNPEWNTPVSAAPLEGDWTAIYPEVVSGNPWNAPHVVRWVLNKPGLLGGDTEYDPDELVFSYSPAFANAPLLNLPTVELDIYRDRHKPRSGALYYVGKGRKTRDLDAVEITPELRANREELADVLNRADVLYTFDGMTGMSDIARLCGCPVILVPDPGEQPRRSTAWVGIGFGLLPLPFDSDAIRAEQIALHEQFREQLAAFIRITQAEAVPA